MSTSNINRTVYNTFHFNELPKDMVINFFLTWIKKN